MEDYKKKIRNLYNKVRFSALLEDSLIAKKLEDVFPELKEESEDERIRQKFINLVKMSNEVGGFALHKWEADEMLAWLEKKGKLKEHNICDTCDEQYSCISPCPVKLLDKQGEQKPTVEIKTPEESLGVDSETYNKIVDECIYGKQEPADKVEPKFKVGDLVKYTNHIKQPIYKINYIEKECYVCTSDDVTLGDKAVMHFAFDNPYLRLVEQKPVDVVEPKFHEGDWVVNKFGDVWHIDSFDKKNYQVSDGKGNYNYFPILKQDEMRLWTIQDAKDGDVLACNSDILSICIFAHFDGINNKYDSFLCYCGLEGEGLGQELNINGYHDDSTGYVPATKEQREELEKAMADAGYRWNAEKKELKKIELSNKPKFKVGNWYQCTKDFFGKGVTFDKNTAYYCAKEGCLQDEYGCHIAIVKDLYDNFKLWTIKDAKNGDVLYLSDETIVIFKDLYNATTFHSYCHIEDGLFDVSKDDMPDWWEGEGFQPATKEQRDLLFQKMREAGYKWDAEKKELRKINSYCEKYCKSYQETGRCFADGECDAKREAEHKSWSKKDERISNAIINRITSSGTLNVDLQSAVSWIKNVKDRIVSHPKQEWSKENEDIIEWLIGYLEYQIMNATITEEKNNCLNAISMLKSLKDRVQPKAELIQLDDYNPYKEVVESIAEMCKHYDKGDLQDFYDNVKVKCKDAKEYDSLYPQNTWKPSDEQMDALHYVTNFDYGGHKATLVSLYEQLKKLRGE